MTIELGGISAKNRPISLGDSSSNGAVFNVDLSATLPPSTPAVSDSNNNSADLSDFDSLSKNTNILTRLRTFNTVFTLSAVQPSTLANLTSNGGIDITALEADVNNPNFCIAKSSGKTSITGQMLPYQEDIESGQYDFYFDNVEISSIPAFNQKTNFSKSTSLNFTLVEPYGIGGLFQALAAATYKIGGFTFQNTTYVLRVQFMGYLDTDDSTPINLGRYGTRYYPIRITGIDSKIDLSGTVYSIKAIPTNELAFSDSNRLAANINVSGNTVGEVVEDFFSKINETVREQYLKGIGKEMCYNDYKHDEYRIKFPKVDNTGQVISDEKNEFYDTKIVYDTERERHERSSVNPFDTKNVTNKGTLIGAGSNPVKSNGSYTSAAAKSRLETKPSIQFSAGANISDCLSAILRDCQLIRDDLLSISQTIESGKGLPDPTGMFRYFYVSIQALPDQAYPFDEITGKQRTTFVYNIFPYKVHIGRLPQFQSYPITKEQFQQRIRRTYNYLYTGKNTEVLNFNLKFNNLFFQTRPINQGSNKNYSNARGATTPEPPAVNPGKKFIDGAQNKKTNQLRPIPIGTYIKSQAVETSGESTRDLSSDVWSVAAKNVHNALLEEVNMMNVEMEIVGDPYYLIQGGIGNIVSRANPQLLGITDTGDADHQTADIYVQVNVNSIKDINRDTGFGIKDTAGEFSGVYRIIEIINNFQSGAFTQRLKMIRINSQPEDLAYDNGIGTGD